MTAAGLQGGSRFSGEASLPLVADWEMTLTPHWQSEGKCWNVEGYAANPLNRDVEDSVGVNLMVRF